MKESSDGISPMKLLTARVKLTRSSNEFKTRNIQGDHVRFSVACDDGPSAMTGIETLRRLAQNREAARKSRLRKKAYVQQLESSRMKLSQLEQELQRARQQGIFISSSGEQSQSTSGNGMTM
ncbi:hypothetical protein QVD17_13326 [Tagetes erecta]|uniref:BZIP domain-containing protein n=1 Tax=Tagetes erecta TaxID=13708 RepID=A0AAD8KVX5_TARER|nr:hypothetical protein QVD17_13326 [Tagetes erecta]